MGTLSHHIEAQGVSTAGISLIREQTEKMKPPRALWVPFELGRPLGPPNEPEFQMEVLHALLDTLKETSGPVLHDFPKDAPVAADSDEDWACMLPLPPVDESEDEVQRTIDGLMAEIGQLKPWYDEFIHVHDRTLFGLSKVEIGAIDQLAGFVASYAKGADVEPPAAMGLPVPAALRAAADDLKTYYLEAVSMQPGKHAPDSATLNRWLFHETRLGAVLYDVRDRLAAAQTDPQARPPAIIPNAFTKRPE